MPATIMMANDMSTSQIVLYYIKGDSVRQGRGGSVNGRRVLPVNRTILQELLISNCFADTQPRYDAATFRRRYRMQRDLFIKHSSDLQHHDRYFKQLPDATGLLGHSTWMKTTTAMRLLAYGVAGDLLQESIGLASSTAMECLKKFFVGIREIYEEQYLRMPTKEDLERIMAINEKRGFPGMIGSIDCMH